MKTFKQFITEAKDEINIEEYKKNTGKNISMFCSQARSVKVNLTSAIEKCLDAVENAPFGRITEIALSYYSNKAEHNLRLMDKIRNELSARERAIRPLGAKVTKFNVPMKETLKYQLMVLNDGGYPRIDYSKVDPWEGGKYKFDWVETSGTANLTEAEYPRPSVEVRKGAFFIGDTFKGADAHKSLEEWKKALTKAKLNASYIADDYKYLLKCADINDPTAICPKIESNFKSGNYKAAMKFAEDLDKFNWYLDNAKNGVTLLGSRYFEIFNDITTLGD